MSKTTNLQLFKHDEPLETNENDFDIDEALNDNWDILDTFAGQVDTRLETLENDLDEISTNLDTLETSIETLQSNVTSLQTDNEINKQDIQTIQQEQETQNTSIQNNTEELELLKNNLPDPITTEESEEITVKDAMNYYGSLDVSGNSTQVQTEEGVNKWWDNDTMNFSNENRQNLTTQTIKAGTYKFSCDVSNLVLGTNTFLALYGENTYSDETSELSFGYIDNITANGRYSKEVVIPKDISTLQLKISATQATNGGSMTISNLCLRTDDSDVYVEYVPDSPSPDYPSKIKNCGDSINIKIENENKYVPFEASWGAFRGIALDFYLDGTVKLNGTAAASGGRDITKNVSTKNLLKAGQAYTMYVEIISGTGETGNIYLNRVDNNAGLRYCKEGEVKTFTQNEDVEVYWGINVIQGNAYDNLMLRFGLFEGTYTYEEIRKKFVIHEEQIIIFPLSEGQKLRLGDYLADDGVHHVRKQRIINLNDYVSTMPQEGLFFLQNKSTGITWDYISVNALCSHFKNAENETITTNNQANANLQDNEFNFRMGDTKDRIYFKNSAFTTLEDWQNFFNENEVLVEYKCIEYVEPYTEEQQPVHNELQKLLLYKGYNHITCIDETKCKMKLTYIPDINYKELQRMNCLGDSITQGLTNDNISFADYLELSVTKYGVSGTTIAKQEGETNSFLERYSSMGQADIIMVMGGTNDCNLDIPLGESTSTNEYEFYGALKSLCSGLITKYADKLIFFATPIKRKTTQTNLQQYAQAIKDVCATYNIPVLDLYNDLNMNPNMEAQYTKYYNDWLHPNNEGHKRIARKVQKYIDNEL